MINLYLEDFAFYTLMLILVLLVIKTVLFFTMGSKRLTFKTYLFFSDNNMRNTKDPKKKKSKNIQNYLSVIIFAIMILLLIVFMSGALFKLPQPS